MLTALTCVIAWYLATWALPVMVFVETFSFIHANETGFLLSVLAAAAAALLSVGLVLLVLFKARNPILCLLARAVFVIPAMIAGYAVVHGVTHEAIDSAIALTLLCGTAADHRHCRADQPERVRGTGAAGLIPVANPAPTPCRFEPR